MLSVGLSLCFGSTSLSSSYKVLCVDAIVAALVSAIVAALVSIAVFICASKELALWKHAEEIKLNALN